MACAPVALTTAQVLAGGLAQGHAQRAALHEGAPSASPQALRPKNSVAPSRRPAPTLAMAKHQAHLAPSPRMGGPELRCPEHRGVDTPKVFDLLQQGLPPVPPGAGGPTLAWGGAMHTKGIGGGPIEGHHGHRPPTPFEVHGPTIVRGGPPVCFRLSLLRGWGTK